MAMKRPSTPARGGGGKPRPQGKSSGHKASGAVQKKRPQGAHGKGGGGAAARPGAGAAGRPSKPRGSAPPAPRADSHRAAGPGPSSEAGTSSKADKRAKKAKLKKNYGLIQEAVKLWEDLRPKQTSPEEKAALVDNILSKVEDKLVELAGNHTASRILQFCLKHGTPQHRARILAQTKANMVVLSKSKYGHHLVRKLINKSSKEQVPDLVRMFQGHMVELLRHPQGADVLMDLYDVATTPLRNLMCAEFFGREFALFGGVSAQGASLTSLSQLLAGVDAAKRRAVLQHITKALVPVMEKGILHPPMTHRLLRDFMECAPGMSLEDACDTLSSTGASLLKMVHTHDGAAVVCALLGYGTAKDRKRIVKAMKGHVGSMAVNEWGYTVVVAALHVLDDTSLASKVICTELRAMLGEALEDAHAARVVLHLLSPLNKRYMSAAALAMLQLPRRTVRGSSGKVVTDVDGDEEELADEMMASGGDDDDDGDDLFQKKQPAGKGARGKQSGKKAAAAAQGGESEDGEGQEEGGEGGEEEGGERVLGLSKKADDVRRRELLSAAAGKQPSLAAAIASATAASAGALLRQPVACDVVVEVCRGGDGGLLHSLAPEGVAAVHHAVVAEAAGEAGGEAGSVEGEGAPAPAAEHVFEHYYASRALRRLILSSADVGAAEGGGSGAVRFVEQLWARAVAGRCGRWVGGHGAKVLGALLHCGSPAVRAAASKELAPLVKPQSVQAWGARFTSGAAAAATPGGGGGGGKQGGKGGGKAQKGSGTAGHSPAAPAAATAAAAAPRKAATTTPAAGGPGSKRAPATPAPSKAATTTPAAAGPGSKRAPASQTPAAATPKSAKRSKGAQP